MKRYLRLFLALALVVSVAGCGNIGLFTRHHKHVYGNDDNKRRIAELEGRVGSLENRMTHPPAPEPASEPAQ